jgi:hypothetical protein
MVGSEALVAVVAGPTLSPTVSGDQVPCWCCWWLHNAAVALSIMAGGGGWLGCPAVALLVMLAR